MENKLRKRFEALGKKFFDEIETHRCCDIKMDALYASKRPHWEVVRLHDITFVPGKGCETCRKLQVLQVDVIVHDLETDEYFGIEEKQLTYKPGTNVHANMPFDPGTQAFILEKEHRWKEPDSVKDVGWSCKPHASRYLLEHDFILNRSLLIDYDKLNDLTNWSIFGTHIPDDETSLASILHYKFLQPHVRKVSETNSNRTYNTFNAILPASWISKCLITF